MKNNLIDKINSVKDNVRHDVRHNVVIYSTAALMALSSCERGVRTSTIVEYDNFIGKAHVRAKKETTQYNGRITSNYNITKTLNGTEIRYIDSNNDLKLDRVYINEDDNRQIYTQGRIFDAASKDYEHLRDTMSVLKTAAQKREFELSARSDSAKIKKYFGN